MKNPSATLSTIAILAVAAVALLIYVLSTGTLDRTDYTGANDSSQTAAVLQIKPDALLYRPGDVVYVEGWVEMTTISGGSVKLEIIDPEGAVWSSLEAKVNSTGDSHASFSAPFRKILESDLSGIYLLRARYGAVTNSSTFLISTPQGLVSEIRDLRLQSIGGGAVSKVMAGDMVMVTGSVVNRGGASKDFSFIVEIRKDSTVRYTGYVSTNISQGEEKVLATGWPVKDEGVFTVYAYVKEDFQSRRIVSNIATLTFKVER